MNKIKIKIIKQNKNSVETIFYNALVVSDSNDSIYYDNIQVDIINMLFYIDGKKFILTGFDLDNNTYWIKEK